LAVEGGAPFTETSVHRASAGFVGSNVSMLTAFAVLPRKVAWLWIVRVKA
jgi:hypothetical protein